MSTEKRENYFDWDEAFIHLCKVIAQRSKDPSTQVGACIVNDKKVIVAMGYNGFPRGCSDDELPWSREGDFCETKYPYVVHAEANAVLSANTSTEGAKMYCGLFPCNECVKVIIQKGIKEIIYEEDKYHDTDACKVARRMLDLAGVAYRQYTPKNDLIFKKKEK